MNYHRLEDRNDCQLLLEQIYCYEPGELDELSDDRIAELYYKEFINE